jgi:AcrR family transcriptional regulator
MRVKSSRKRQEIIEIAGKIFLELGYGATNMSAIAAALGGSKSTLYNHFASKELLFEAFVVDAGRENADALSKIDLREADGETLLVKFGKAYLKLLLSVEVLSINRLVISEAQRFPEAGAIFHENGPKTVKQRFEALFLELKNRGVLNCEDHRRAAVEFKALCEADLYEDCLWALRGTPGSEELEQHASNAASTILRIYAPSAKVDSGHRVAKPA